MFGKVIELSGFARSIVGVMNKVFTLLIPRFYGTTHSAMLPGLAKPMLTQVSSAAAIWAVEGALLLGILTVVALAFRALKERFAEGSKAAVASALLAATNTASEYGFGAVIAARPGFHKEAYRDIFAITLVKTVAVVMAIGMFYLTGIY